MTMSHDEDQIALWFPALERMMRGGHKGSIAREDLADDDAVFVATVRASGRGVGFRAEGATPTDAVDAALRELARLSEEDGA